MDHDNLLEKKIISNASKIEVAQISFICNYYFNHSLFGYVKNCMLQLLFLNFNKQDSLEQWEKDSEHYLVG